jgi:glycosyltransferase involved in cell wall biosynthesis
LGPTMPVISRMPACSCIYIDSRPFSWTWFAGISRYTARLSLALAARVPVRFFDEDKEVLLPRNLDWSQDQDLETWGRRTWQGRRRPLGTLPPDSIGLYCAWRPGQRTFPYEVSVLHDFCPVIVPWAFTDGDREGFGKWLENSLASDLVLSVSHSTKTDAAWFSALDQERIVVASSGPSLCVKTHLHRGKVERSEKIGLVVSTIEPRKNASFLFEWFQKTTLLPPDMELWWVGKLGWMISDAELQRMANPPGGRRVRFLGNVSDAELCRLYQKVSWSIYPSRYEGFGFPILDSLRHGTPVLASCTSSMGEFDHPGVYFFDPQDPATVDMAWQRFQSTKPVALSQAPLEDLYNWDLVARAVLSGNARCRHELTGDPPSSLRLGSGRPAVGHVGHGPFTLAVPSPERAPAARRAQGARVRIGIEIFGTQTVSRQRGIGQYDRNLVAAMLARDPGHDYILYAQNGPPTDQIPSSANAVVRLLAPDPARGETTLAHAMERLTTTNPDGLDVLLLLNPLEMAPGYDPPAKPLNGLKIVAVIHDLFPLLFQEEFFSRRPGPDYVGRYFKALSRLRCYDTVLTDSESTRHDVVSLLGLSADRVVTIGMATDSQFFLPDRTDPMPTEPRTLLQLLEITRPFVYSAGSPDYRHNITGVIEAFAMLPVAMREAHQLVLTYPLTRPGRDRVRRYAQDRGVSDQLVLTDWLADKALRVLYQRCAAFVSASIYDGFALPILEAMHCGAPVIAGNNSSQIEIVGDAGLLFNVADSGELTTQLVRILDQAGPASELRKRAPVRARQFQWRETADKALDSLTRSHPPRPIAHPRYGRRRTPRRRIAFFSPLPPLRSEASDYSARLLDELKSRYAIDLYHDAGYAPHIGLRSSDFGCYDYRVFERNARVLDYHTFVYQIGETSSYAYMHEALMRRPGVVTLHDLGMANSFVEHASAIIVLSRWSLQQVQRRFRAHFGKTCLVPFGATAHDRSLEHRRATRARFQIPAEALVIASLGSLQSPKMNAETVEAFAPLARTIPDSLLIFVGDETDDGEARRTVTELGLQGRVRFLGYQPTDALTDLAAIVEIGVCLRRPSATDETPGALLNLLGLGVPTIVSDVGPLSSLPSSVVRKVPSHPDGLATLSQALRELADDRSGRAALGRAAWDFVRQNHAWSHVADLYEEIIERTATDRTVLRADRASGVSGPRIAASPKRSIAAN